MNKIIFLTSMICACACAVFAQTQALWGDLKPGRYDIGFKFERQYDDTRPYREAYDEAGKHGRPLQMFIWYPAEESKNAHRVRYEEYLYLNDTEAAPWQWSENEKRALLQTENEELKKYAGNLAPLRDAITAAGREAKPAQGKFPLVLFGAGGGTDGHAYSVLCEYLASHGYVAIAHTALGLQAGARWPFDSLGIAAQIDDLKFILRSAQRMPNVDAKRLALLSWSVGGVSQALLQMQNSEVDALVSLDAATGYEYGRDLLRAAPGFDIKKMNVPYLHMHGDAPVPYDVPKNFEFYETLAAADAYLLRFKNLNHGNFVPMYGIVPSTLLRGERAEEVVTSYAIACRYVLNFLNAYVKGERSAREFLRQTPSSNDIPEEVFTEIRMKVKD